MVKSVIGEIVTYYASSAYQVKTDGTNLNTRKYYAFGNTTVAMRENDVLTWLLTDQINSTTITANEDGTLVSEIKYTAFGEVRSLNGVLVTDNRYTGQREETEIGLYFYVARWYDPYLNHFIQADTIVPDAGNLNSHNRYAYVNNNPLTSSDPTGHYCLGPNCAFPSGTPSPFSPQDPLNISPASTPAPNVIQEPNQPVSLPDPEPPLLRVGSPDWDNRLPDGNPPPPHVDGLPDEKSVWRPQGQGSQPGYQNLEDSSGSIWSPHRGRSNERNTEGEDPHWDVNQPGQRRGQEYPPNKGWGRGTNDRRAPGTYNPETGRYESAKIINQRQMLTKAIITSGTFYNVYRAFRVLSSPFCGPFAGVCAVGP